MLTLVDAASDSIQDILCPFSHRGVSKLDQWDVCWISHAYVVLTRPAFPVVTLGF